MRRLTNEDYIRIEQLVKSGVSSFDIAEKFGCSIATISKARIRINKGIPLSKMGRPALGPMSSFSSDVQKAVSDRRDHRSKKGCKSIHHELEMNPKPSETTIYRFLKANKKLKANAKAGKEKVLALLKATRPHEVWEIDSRGHETLKEVGSILFVDIVDYVSGVYACIYPAQVENYKCNPSILEYRTALRIAMHNFGRPERVQTDHASVFYDNKHESPFPTTLNLWLVALGITPQFSRKGIPQDQGSVEKSHQTVWAQLYDTKGYPNWQALFKECEKEQLFLNSKYPSRALNGAVPFDDPKAIHSGRDYSIYDEESQLDLSLVYAYLAKQKWERTVNAAKCFSLGGQQYYVAEAQAEGKVIITFDATKIMFRLEIPNHVCVNKAFKRLTKQNLIGGENLQMGDIQLRLPFFCNEDKSTEIVELITTTL